MTKKIKTEIWILVDDKPGTAAQAIGLAEEIAKETNFEYKIINLTYSFFSDLPNFLFSSSLLRISCSSKKNFKNLEYFPSLIIAAGRRAAPLALYLKKKSQGQSKVIQIMNPNLSFSKFDLVILPKHDAKNNEFDETKFPNLISTIGALNKINDKKILAEREKFFSWFGEIKKTKIALLIGGSSKKTFFDEASAEKLAKNASEIAEEMDATLLVLNSRRTDAKLNQALKANLKGDFKFFDWQEVGSDNPYLAILGYADFFIITGDSVSMISECCSTGKPVYIFDEKEISSAKHRKFHHNLFEKNYAKKLVENATKLENFSPNKLQETKRIASLVRTKF